jgi:hypothetical protein
MGILILLSSFSKLKPRIVFLVSLVGTYVSLFSGILVCVSLVSNGFVCTACVSVGGLVTIASFVLFHGNFFFGGTFVEFFSLGFKSYFCWSSTIIESASH